MGPPVDDRDVDYHADRGTYRTSYDPETESLSIRLLETVAAVTGVEPTALDPLDEYIDPDALDAIFEPLQSRAQAHGSLSFDYEGLLVIVHSDGEIELRESV
jgi:hypothetical protein